MILHHITNLVFIYHNIRYQVSKIFLEVDTGATRSLETKCRTRLENASASSSKKLGEGGDPV
jgi:hypothetical protein